MILYPPKINIYCILININMITAIKKLLYNTDPKISGHGIHITNITQFDQDSILVSTTNPSVSLNKIKTKTYNNGLTKLLGPSEQINISPVESINTKSSNSHITNAKFINRLRDSPKELCIIPKNQFSVVLISENRSKIEQKYFSINNDTDLREQVVELINNKYTDVCKCRECYHLAGFVQLCEFNLIVQLICSHTHSQRKIFILTSSMEKHNGGPTVPLKHTSVLAVIDFYRLCRNNKIKRDIAISSVITSVAFNGHDQLYFISSYGKRGHVWSVPYFFGLNFFGVPVLLTKLNHSPRGVCVLKYNKNYIYDDYKEKSENNLDMNVTSAEKLLVVCDSKIKFTYYSILIKKEDNHTSV